MPGALKRLIIARNVLSGEVKYFISNEIDAPTETVLHVAFRRWQLERLFEDAKGSVGLDQSEIRKYLALKRHMILSMVICWTASWFFCRWHLACPSFVVDFAGCLRFIVCDR